MYPSGCDGSIMLDNDAENGMVNEKDTPPNETIEFDIVDDIKTALENACPGVLSCDDILTLDLRLEFHWLAVQQWPYHLEEKTVGLQTVLELLTSHLLSDSFSQLQQKFRAVGLTIQLISLLYQVHTRLDVLDAQFFVIASTIAIMCYVAQTQPLIQRLLKYRNKYVLMAETVIY
ncbi:hypothetical protein CRYUN_Cryun11dG0069300 [Craigia yunnanensis]